MLFELIVFGGDLVGGGFVFVMFVVLCDCGELLLVGVILFLLWIDLVGIGGMMCSNDGVDLMFVVVVLLKVVKLYFGDEFVMNLYVLLFYVDFMGLLLLYI